MGLLARFLKTVAILSVLLFVLSSTRWLLVDTPLFETSMNSSPSRLFNETSVDRFPNSQDWTKTIWQTSKLPADQLSGEEGEHYDTWLDLNPGYAHELMTDAKMEAYVREKFKDTEVESVYFEVKDYIMRSDLIRYLILLADGGVYNDLDVGCVRPIDDWVPKQFHDDATVVLGVEVDNEFGPDGRTFEGGKDLFELVNWTMMAKPGQPFIKFLVDKVIENLHQMAKDQSTSLDDVEYTVQQVLDTTGPAALTKAFFEYASDVSNTDVTYKNFTKITKPKLVGDVVVHPIFAFGAGHQVEWAGFEQDDSMVLVHHYFKGSWKEDHPNVVPASGIYGNDDA